MSRLYEANMLTWTQTMKLTDKKKLCNVNSERHIRKFYGEKNPDIYGNLIN